MYNHAPSGYECPFCALQHDLDSQDRMGWVFEEGAVYCMVPTH